MKYKIAVIDDDPALLKMLVQALEGFGHVVKTATEGKAAIRLVTEEKPDLVILDWNLPELNGLEICRFLRTHPSTLRTPILMLTAFDNMRQKVSAFDTGADDYLTKPFDMQELIARVSALLRRGGPAESPMERFSGGGVQLNVTEHVVTLNKRVIELRPKEFDLLHVLMSSAGRVISRKQLLERVWGYGEDITSRTIDSHIARLREKLGDKDGAMIETVPGFGYRFGKSEAGRK